MHEAGFDVRDGRAVKAALLHELRDWAPEAREMVAACDEGEVWPRSLLMLPVGFTWDSRPGATILGDAAHLMTPFVGEGVNAALKDAMELADAIAAALKRGWSRHVLAEETRRYEDGMFRRIHKVQKRTEDMMKLMLFTEGAPRTVMHRWIVRSMSDELSALKLLLVRLAVCIYYFLFTLVY
ncbi:Monooxygenase FAD-binding protein [Macrophomina phaseolina MS6]|uniref:Monooxygenase FAD-binding protein n=1 Tax=Macrophomina phaseolina (strain MS6) TaxID=1126212 RepID=K2S427_MACPH|nr:Monooxygenase FAD-binding protein [Macrophomina phaseolina MS6]